MAEDRPQDVGRSHGRKRGRASADPLLERYERTMRTWLGIVLDRLEGTPVPDGLTGPLPPKMPDVTEAGKLFDLGIKLARELGAAIDPKPPGAGSVGVPRVAPPKRTSVDVR